MEFNQILNLKNKEFAEECLGVLRNINIKDENIQVLLDVEKTNDALQSKYSYTYPILKEVSITGIVMNEMRMENGNYRYYPNKYFINGKAYLLCNDWYYPSLGKKNIKDNRTPFLKWTFKMKEMK